MNLPFVFKPEALREFEEAVAWYEAQRPGLGRQFATEVEVVLHKAQASPERFRRIRGTARKIRLRRFNKYSIYFAVKDDAFAVLAVFHAARNPVHLEQRLQ